MFFGQLTSWYGFDLYCSCIRCGNLLVNITITIFVRFDWCAQAFLLHPTVPNVLLTNGQMILCLSLSLIPLPFISEELRAKRKKELKKDNASRIKATVDEVYRLLAYSRSVLFCFLLFKLRYMSSCRQCFWMRHIIL